MIVKLLHKKVITCSCGNKFAYDKEDIIYKDLSYVPAEGKFPYIECPYCHSLISL